MVQKPLQLCGGRGVHEVCGALSHEVSERFRLRSPLENWASRLTILESKSHGVCHSFLIKRGFWASLLYG